MSEISRFSTEYGELSRLPLFGQRIDGATPTVAGHDAPVVGMPTTNSDVDWSIVAALRAQASEQLSQAVASDRSRLDRAGQQELGRSIVVAGAQGAGKTTLVRALCAEIDAMEAIGTFETEYELHLHELGRHKVVHAWEARPGSGERGADGRQAGEFTLDEALVDSFRFNLSRQIVGEVRGKEIWAMIKAMESGTGSISTTHARRSVRGLIGTSTSPPARSVPRACATC